MGMTYILLISSLVVLLAILLWIGSKGGGGFPWIYRTPGEKGEYKVAGQLSVLDPQRYFIINDLVFRKSNGLTSQIDHVVVSPYGVFVIETKNISGYVYGSETANQWLRRWKGYSRRGHYKQDELSFDNPILQNEAHIDALSERIGRGMQIPYYSIIAFSPVATLKVRADKHHVIYWNEIRSCIYGYDKPIMDIEEAKNLYENIVALNIRDPEVRNQHAESAYERKRNFEEKANTAVSKGICPRCGGNLVLREGMYGRFYGCSNYPNCKYTQQI